MVTASVDFVSMGTALTLVSQRETEKCQTPWQSIACISRLP
jgi:hypothetical protein